MANCFCLKWRPDIVKALDFRHCNLLFVPEEVFEFGETLEELFLDSNDIRDLPRVRELEQGVIISPCKLQNHILNSKAYISGNHLCRIATQNAIQVQSAKMYICIALFFPFFLYTGTIQYFVRQHSQPSKLLNKIRALSKFPVHGLVMYRKDVQYLVLQYSHYNIMKFIPIQTLKDN